MHKPWTLLRSRAVGAPTCRVASACLVATIALGGAAAVPAVGESQTDSAAALRRDEATLAARSRSAVLELYGIETRLAAARARLVSLRARSAALSRARATATRRLGIARQTLGTAERLLSSRLRALYERGDTDPLAVVLGAGSLEQAMDAIDGLELAAEQDRAIIGQTRAARARYARLSSVLRTRSVALGRLVQDARAEETALARSRAERAAYVARLASERRVTAARLARIEAAATAARARARTVAAAAPSPAFASDTARAVAASGRGTLIVTASGYSLGGPTATGVPSGWGVVAVDPSVIPLGTRMTIPGYGSGVASDTGPAVRGAAIDLWFPTTAEAFAWGRRTVTITLD
jgi:3D (Asp-Asp-Asp) domain-containing protein